MTERLGNIPLKDRTKEIEMAYYAMQEELRKELMSLDVANYQELEAMRIQERTNTLLKKLNRLAYSWSKKSVPEAYKESYIVARTSLEILGAKKNKYYDSHKHTLTMRTYSEAIIDDLIRANMSIKNTINSYLYLARVAHSGLMQIQEFDVGDEEVISDIITDTIRQGRERYYASKRIHEYLRLQLLGGQFIDRKGRHYNLRDYSKMVARTRLRQAQTEAVRNTCEQYDNDLVQWSKHANPCPICQEYEGKVYSLMGRNKNYPLIPLTPPAHPNCVLPDTRCVAPGGLIAGIRAKYKGQVIQLTFANIGQLTVTKNHLLLTPYGFIPAHLLCKGDDVFYCPDFKRIITNYPYNNGQPSVIKEIVNTLSESQGMAVSSVPIAPENLHNDGRFCDGNIDIIRSNGFLRNTFKSSFFKKHQTLPFNPGDSDTFSFPSEGNLFTMLKGLAFTADSIMGGHRLPSPFFSTQSRSLDALNFTIGTRRNTSLENNSSDNHPMNPKFFSNINIEPSSLIESDGFLGVKSSTFSPSKSMAFAGTSKFKSVSNKSFSDCFRAYIKTLGDFASRQSRFIKTDKLIDIREFNYSGHVYDLHTHTSLYLANGILSSNCEHSISPTSEIAIRVSEAWQ